MSETWTAKKARMRGLWYVCDTTDAVVAETYTEKHARLIKEAPKMEEMLRRSDLLLDSLHTCLNADKCDIRDFRDEARAVLARIRGEATNG